MTTNTNHERAFAPSWVDHLTAWVERLPGPNWPYYLGLGLFLILVQVIALWIEDASPISDYMPVYTFLALVISFFLALFHYLDQRAGAALTALRPALQALAQQAQGDVEQALAALGQALTLAEPEGYVRIFLDEGPP